MSVKAREEGGDLMSIAYVMETTRGNIYALDAGGNVIGRSNGPKGWNYSRGWRILGFAKRHHSRVVASLESAVAGADVGQGWVHDLDHGTYRMWGTERLRRIYVPSADYAATLERVWEIPVAA